ncbi:MAG: zinc dependent phospholipase C family protein [Erysipelotrichaceae bacterium]|jgi:hypothetical protein
MPSVLSHCLCGEDAAKKCSNKNFQDLIKENEKIFYLGCQGPDPFMFYHHFPFQNKERVKTVRNCSRLIHKGKVNDFFSALLKYAKKKDDAQLFVYVGGFFSHHALDSIAHPYVNYQTGSAYKNNLRLHQIFESQIDLALLTLKGIKPEDYRADRKIVKLEDSAEKIAEMLSHCIKEVFDYEVTLEDAKDSLDDMARAEKVFTHSKGKYKFFKYLEKLMKKPNVAVNMMMPLEYDEKMDAMNYGRELWHSPVDLTFASNETFMELYDKSVNQTHKILELLSEYVDGKIDEDKILEIVGNRNYDSGSSDGSTMKYFKLDSGIRDYGIRLMKYEDLDTVAEIYKEAREFMRETGNPQQWKDGHPSIDLIKKDIENKTGYVVELNNKIVGVFAFILGEDVTYNYIEGKWLNNFAYGTIHRIAGKKEAKGILSAAVSYGSRFTNNIRIDTHKDNKVMQHLLDKLKFRKCGIIYLLDGNPRIAYQKEVG